MCCQMQEAVRTHTQLLKARDAAQVRLALQLEHLRQLEAAVARSRERMERRMNWREAA